MRGGTAETWAELYLESAQEIDPNTGNERGLGTWINFRNIVTTVFGIIDEAMKRSIELDSLKYTSDTTLDDFNANFLRIGLASGIRDPQALLILYRKKLPNALRRKIMDQYPAPADLTGWMEKAQALDNSYRANREMEKSMESSRPTIRKEDTKGKKVRAIKSERPDQKERSELMRKGLCFICRKQGHLARDCPDKPDKPEKQRTDQKKVRSATIEEVDEEDKEQSDDDEHIGRFAVSNETDF